MPLGCSIWLEPVFQVYWARSKRAQLPIRHQQVHVGGHHHVGHVAVHEQLAGQQADHLVGRQAAVRAADPQELRSLLTGQAREELGVAAAQRFGPVAIVLQQLMDVHGSLRCKARLN
jgi:hypothetical protein